MSQREQATERMIQGASRKQLSSGDGYRHATRQSSESCRNNKVRVARDSVVFVHTRRLFVLDRSQQRWYSWTNIRLHGSGTGSHFDGR